MWQETSRGDHYDISVKDIYRTGQNHWGIKFQIQIPESAKTDFGI